MVGTRQGQTAAEVLAATWIVSSRLVADQATGLRHVVVNGTPIRTDHAPMTTELMPGQLLGPKRYAG